MKCRLKHNAVSGGRLYPRDSIVDDGILSERQKIECAAYDLENRSGVLLLRDLSFQSDPIRGSDGVPTSYPVMLIAGELMDLSKVPAAMRQKLKEGEHFKTDWSFEDQAEVRRAAKEAYLKQFETESAVPTGWGKR
jgi:hypothetical protein